jgi:type VI secretion system protein ImpL
MLALIRRFMRVLLLILGLLLIALFIWFAGPYFAFADYHPLESTTARLITIGVVVGLYGVVALIRRLRVYRASDQLAAAVLKPAAEEAVQLPPDVVKLRERFEEGVATLKQQRRSGRNLYELPWYVIIGAPGSGKTTALLNSGLKFPLESRVGKGALKGVGGTRNCDWWFTDEAIFLDTAGRYTTQDSDAASDSTGWAEFLALLRKYRKRRPVNGVILTISASDLMTQGEMSQEAHVEAARRRLLELNRELHIQLPVYLMVTKCDLIAGFAEYFDDLDQEGRTQVWGVTFPYELTVRGEAAQAFPRELEALIIRLNERLFPRIEDERDVRRRSKVFAFPQQLAAISDALSGFVNDVFASTRFDQQIMLRGVYFTSGTQEGTPIDRLLGAIGRGFGVGAEVVAPTPGRGKAYFVERLLKQVMIGESGLAGVNTKGELQKAALQLVAYTAAAVIAVLSVIALSVSYNRNRVYVDQVAADLEQLKKVPAVPSGSSAERVLPRLNAVRAVADSANRYRDAVPWRMRWGLYQGAAMGNGARDGYVRELDSLLLPLIAARLRDRLAQYRSEPEKLYEYLKAYLMLGEPSRLDKQHLQQIVDLEWETPTRASTSPPQTVATHFKSLLESTETLRPVALDPAIIAQSRTAIRQVSIPRIVYGRLQRYYATDKARAVRLDVGGASDQVLRRRSGTSLSEPVSSIYSRPVFNEVSGVKSLELVKQFATDDWVWGEAGMFANNPLKLVAELTDLYERDYINAWNAVLSDLEIVRFSSTAETAKALGVLAGQTSPLRVVLQTIADNTRLVSVAEPPKADGGVASTGKKITDGLGKLLAPVKEAAGVSAAPPGSLVTAHFQPLHRLFEGEPGNTPMDRLLARFDQLQVVLAAGPSGAGPSVALQQSLQGLKQESAGLPPIIQSVTSGVVGSVDVAITGDVSSELERRYTELERRYRREVVPECEQIVSGRYPFTPNSPADVPLQDFGHLFGYGGVFDTFFQANLASLVDTERSPWSWRPGTVRASDAILRPFEAAQNLREIFFRAGSQVPGIRFNAMFGTYDAGAARFSVEFEGQTIDSRNTQRVYSVFWPGPSPAYVNVSFEQRFGGTVNRSFHGPWAFFHMIDSATVQRESDVRNILTVNAGNLQGQVIFEAASVRNPFATRQWQQFTCGS